jgi:hypothetical protein
VDISHLERPGFWSDIWHLNIPLKIKNLLVCPHEFACRIKVFNTLQIVLVVILMLKNWLMCFFTCPFAMQGWFTTGL